MGVLGYGLLLGGQSSGGGGQQALRFGCSPQDCWAALGAPDARTDKAAGAMGIHAGGSGAEVLYFLHWRGRGVDVAFCAEAHAARKFVLHGNVLGHAEFGQRAKCRWALRRPRRRGGGVVAAADSRWADVQRELGGAARGAVAAPAGWGARPASPFGHTFVQGFEGVAFECLRSGAIASCTLFDATGGGGEPAGDSDDDDEQLAASSL